MGYFSFLYYYDWNYIVLIIPCLLLSIFAQAKVSSSFNKYSQIRNSRNMTGAQAAEYVLRANGVTGVQIQQVAGKLTDHFDPRSNVIRLSESVYGSNSIAAVGVACHEAGHAVQHAEGYFPNKLRSAIVPIANFGSKLSWIFIILGLASSAFQALLYIGIVFFAISVLFTLVTLPVEFNASSRALACIRNNELLTGEEYKGAKSTLQAAALTYVASAATAIAQLLRLILLANNRRR
jgi:hypothetical protein